MNYLSEKEIVDCLKAYDKSASRLVLIAGPVAVGKDYFIDKFLCDSQSESISHRKVNSVSTKEPRLIESGKPDYEYVAPEVFVQKIAEGFFIEYESYVRADGIEVWFGTSHNDVRPNSYPEEVIWKVSPSRLVQLIKLVNQCAPELQQLVQPIYLGVTSLLILKTRARKRAQSEHEWKDRLGPNFLNRLRNEYAHWQENKNLLVQYTMLNNGDTETKH